MRLSKVIIEDFRRISKAEIVLEPATFLIGQNNHGKSSVIRAIELLLTMSSPAPSDFRMDSDGSIISNKITITGIFSGIPSDVASSRGFKGRVINGQYHYRKTYIYDTPAKPIIECLEYPYKLKQEFEDVKTGNDLIERGIPSDRLKGWDLNKKLKAGWERDFLDLVVEFDTSAEPSWKPNPGGIPQNVISKFPKLIHVPSIADEGEISRADRSTAISEVLGILFEDLLEGNAAAATVEAGLKQLEEQMSPDEDGSLIAKLCADVNKIIGSVFPGCGIRVQPSLQSLADVLKPKYIITMFSNVYTDVSRQGTGLLRTAIFAMLRYHAHLKQQRDLREDIDAGKTLSGRPLFIAFEEPELYLHPSAANLLRDTIYALGKTDQVICTTHSPWMIDLSKDWQSMTKMIVNGDGSVSALNYGVSRELLKLNDDDRSRVKMLQVFDDEMSRVFFADRVVVVEGDSEVIVIKKTLELLSDLDRKEILSRCQVVKARGKASIVSLVRYFKALSIEPFVIHDRDRGSEAAKFNGPIAEAVGDANRVIVLEECLEHVLGYEPTSSDKPYKAFQVVSNWKRIEDVPEKWLEAFGRAVGWGPKRVDEQGGIG